MKKRVQGEAKVNRRMQGVAVTHGPSILESMEEQLRVSAKKYRKMKKKDKNRDTMRGVVRGLALGVLIIRSPYEKNNPQAVIAIEESVGVGVK